LLAPWLTRPHQARSDRAATLDVLGALVGVVGYVTCSPHLAETVGLVVTFVRRTGAEQLDAWPSTGFGAWKPCRS
jgi:16S rRNA C967 or C1407 C5-methylase (RsmB/RsmF family)